mmetsp:Transcript_81874/g.235229  ORF Transcript_81874/g.235229 Transcript_81874/m.235229 type:complete len:240 (-) Transcript_81874:1064-1783(-)
MVTLCVPLPPRSGWRPKFMASALTARRRRSALFWVLRQKSWLQMRCFSESWGRGSGAMHTTRRGCRPLARSARRSPSTRPPPPSTPRPPSPAARPWPRPWPRREAVARGRRKSRPASAYSAGSPERITKKAVRPSSRSSSSSLIRRVAFPRTRGTTAIGLRPPLGPLGLSERRARRRSLLTPTAPTTRPPWRASMRIWNGCFSRRPPRQPFSRRCTRKTKGGRIRRNSWRPWMPVSRPT